MLRPSVQLPAGIHGWARYKDFGRTGKGNWLRTASKRRCVRLPDEDGEGLGGPIPQYRKTTPYTVGLMSQGPDVDTALALFVCMTYK